MSAPPLGTSEPSCAPLQLEKKELPDGDRAAMRALQGENYGVEESLWRWRRGRSTLRINCGSVSDKSKGKEMTTVTKKVMSHPEGRRNQGG